jgi:predicted RNA-binding protein with PUA-like domain
MAPKKPAAAATRIGYWLVKTEPESFSVDDFLRCLKRTTHWDGVRNYQARNYLRDAMKKGQQVLVYHSNATPPAVVGLAHVVREAYPDPSAFDPSSPYFDPASKESEPRWFMVDIQLLEKFPHPLTLPELRQYPALNQMELLRKGSRLSVQPVKESEFKTIVQLAREQR